MLDKWIVYMRGGWTHVVTATSKQDAMNKADRLMRMIDDPSRAYHAEAQVNK